MNPIGNGWWIDPSHASETPSCPGCQTNMASAFRERPTADCGTPRLWNRIADVAGTRMLGNHVDLSHVGSEFLVFPGPMESSNREAFIASFEQAAIHS
jgi:hypothetical protein